MDVFLIFILCCFAGISARPGINRIKRETKAMEGNGLIKGWGIPTWPESQDMFHLPKPFSLEDEIVVIVDMGDSERLNISLVTDEYATDNSTVCTFVADTNLTKFTFHHNNNTFNITDDKNAFIKGSEFHAKFIRREDIATQEPNILVIENFEFINITSMDNIKYIKITGDKIRVKEMKFKFA